MPCAVWLIGISLQLIEDVTGAEVLSKIPFSHLHGCSLGEEEERAVYPYGIFSSFQWDAVR